MEQVNQVNVCQLCRESTVDVEELSVILST